MSTSNENTSNFLPLNLYNPESHSSGEGLMLDVIHANQLITMVLCLDHHFEIDPATYGQAAIFLSRLSVAMQSKHIDIDSDTEPRDVPRGIVRAAALAFASFLRYSYTQDCGPGYLQIAELLESRFAKIPFKPASTIINPNFTL